MAVACDISPKDKHNSFFISHYDLEDSRNQAFHGRNVSHLAANITDQKDSDLNHIEIYVSFR